LRLDFGIWQSCYNCDLGSPPYRFDGFSQNPSGHRILITGSMNYIEREMQGLRPDIALIGSSASRREIYDHPIRNAASGRTKVSRQKWRAR
jgi:hypothetical protein